MHASFGAQPTVGIVADDVDRDTLDARHFAIADVDDFRLEATLIGPAPIHPHQHLNPILSFGAAGARLDIQKAGMRIHLTRKHALKLELLYSLLDASDVALNFSRGGFVVLLHRHRQDLTRVSKTVGDSINRVDDVLELR